MTSRSTPADPADVTVRTTGRVHGEPAIDDLLPAIRMTDQLVFVGRYADGIAEFTLDVLDGAVPASESKTLLAHGTALGRNICDFVRRVDAELAGARTGRLVRVFLTAERGAVHAGEVVSGQQLVGISLVGEDADPAVAFHRAVENDRVIAERTTLLRYRFSQPPLNLGGYSSEPTAHESLDEPEDPPIVEAEDADLAELGSAVLRRMGTHYLSIHAGERTLLAGDVLADPSVSRFALGMSASDLRRFYTGFGQRVGEYARELAVTVNTVIGRRVERFTLDVERGALYFRRLGPGRYLFAVTLDQNAVAVVEDQVETLARRIAER